MSNLRSIFLIIFVLATTVYAADTTIAGQGMVRDTYLQDRLGGDDNYGGATALFAGWKDDDYPNSRRRIYLHFSVPQQYDTCAACTLAIYITAFDGDPDTIDVFWCTRDVAAYCGDNTMTSDPEDGEMTWLSYFDDDDGTDSAWTAGGGDMSSGSPLGTLIYDGTGDVNRYYSIAIARSSADSLLNGSRENNGLFLMGRVGGAYGSGNTLLTASSVEYGDNSFGPRLTFYSVGSKAATDSTFSSRRRR